MWKQTISVIGLILCTWCVACQAQYHEYVAIEKALESMSKIVVKYKNEFDNKVQFVKLQEAIDSVDESMLEYQGKAKSKLDSIRNLNSDARITYRSCVGPVFEWCVSINSTLEIFIPYVTDPQLTDKDKKIIWEMTHNVMKDGQEKTSKSLDLLKHVMKKTSELKNMLDSMLHDMHDDFGPEGHYGKLRAELENAIEESNKSRNAIIAAGVIGAIFGVILAVVTGPIGVALVMAPIYLALGLGGVLNGSRKATYEEQLQFIQTYFNTLDDKIRFAIKIAGEVNEELKDDQINLYALSGLISAAENDKKTLLMDSIELRARLVPSFRNLGKQCYEYAKSHGYTPANYPARSRARRQAMETCQTQRSRAMKMLTESLQSNSTLASKFSKAHAILSGIDCESMDFSEPQQNEVPPALQLLEDIKIKDEISPRFASILSELSLKNFRS